MSSMPILVVGRVRYVASRLPPVMMRRGVGRSRCLGIRFPPRRDLAKLLQEIGR